MEIGYALSAEEHEPLALECGPNGGLQQVGPDQEPCFRLYESDIAPWAARELAVSR